MGSESAAAAADPPPLSIPRTGRTLHATYKTFKRHDTHINNPFPSPPKSLPLIHASLSFDPACCHLSLPRTFPLGSSPFRLSWSPSAGGSLSLHSLHSPHSHPTSSLCLWSTIPGQAFLSAAAVETQVEESRGSFAVQDGAALFVPRRQTVEKIEPFPGDDRCRLIFQPNNSADDDAADPPHSPALVVTGLVFAAAAAGARNRGALLSARYWFLLEQKSDTQVGFRVAFGEYDLRRPNSPPNAPRLGEEEDDDDDDGGVELREFNRVFLTHSSEGDEKFYGFGEQFSHVEFKGKRVPILVQEQGIGRGDQPITFAANFISYRW